MKKIAKYLPGALMALVIAAAAKLLETWEASAGLHFIGASVIALFIGMLVNAFYKPNAVTQPGIKFTSKKILKFAIILLGASLNIRTVLTVGRLSLTVMVFTLATCFGLGALIGKALGLNWKTASLINAGTGICGGSAIAAIAPVIEADDMDVGLRPVGHFPVRHGHDRGVPAAGAGAGSVRRGLRPLGGHGGERHLQRGGHRLRLQRGRRRFRHHGQAHPHAVHHSGGAGVLGDQSAY